MEHSVPLEKLPQGLEFPPDLCDRIRFDPKARRLIFRGFMSKSEFDRLCVLSDDWAYRRPLEDLFRECTSDEAPRRGLRAALTLLTGL
jgi:hypothetical protein